MNTPEQLDEPSRILIGAVVITVQQNCRDCRELPQGVGSEMIHNFNCGALIKLINYLNDLGFDGNSLIDPLIARCDRCYQQKGTNPASEPKMLSDGLFDVQIFPESGSE